MATNRDAAEMVLWIAILGAILGYSKGGILLGILGFAGGLGIAAALVFAIEKGTDALFNTVPGTIAATAAICATIGYFIGDGAGMVLGGGIGLCLGIFIAPWEKKSS